MDSYLIRFLGSRQYSIADIFMHIVDNQYDIVKYSYCKLLSPFLNKFALISLPSFLFH